MSKTPTTLSAANQGLVDGLYAQRGGCVSLLGSQRNVICSGTGFVGNILVLGTDYTSNCKDTSKFAPKTYVIVLAPCANPKRGRVYSLQAAYLRTGVRALLATHLRVGG